MVSKIIVPKEISGAENNASVFVVKALESMKKSGGELFGKKLFPANAEYYSFVGLAALVIIGIPLCLIIRVHVPLVMTIVVAVYAVCAMIYRTVLMAKNH